MKEGYKVSPAWVQRRIMKYRAYRSLAYGLLAAVSLLCRTEQVYGIILHPDGEPNLESWTDRPDCNVVGRWSSNATCVVVAPNWLVTTRHQNTFPSTVTIGGTSYTCHYRDEWKGGPSGDADIQLVRLTTADGANPELEHYASPYTGTGEVGEEIVIGGYGDGRGDVLWNYGTVYGYDWDHSANTTLRLGTNRIEGTEDGSALGSHTSDIVIADFDGLNEGQSTSYEGTLGGHDSGGGWLINDGGQWKLAGLSRAVGIHYEEGHYGDPDYILYEAWFRSRSNPLTLAPDYLDAVRVSSYAEWILETISVEGDLTGDDWVDFHDIAVLGAYWWSTDCGEHNDWCEGADFEPKDGSVNYRDLRYIAERWLSGWEY